ncbi:Neuronal acetylcholine receptor subunit beta-3 [Clonorchis sinensis]|uniref:Neuronal acetylcholine receptor subunit beta-3 n=1 Tax=Clonorchis sinensis TaxID=79923 RepID=A0A419QDN5_CLOSI|nr:Neuronal acetylcholine receptor subunit beta-3 [Clonorchis sinensis]
MCEWIDERLHWDPLEYNNLSTLRVPCDKLWLPDIVLYNSADDYTSGYMQSRAMVGNTGNVFWSPPAKLRSACKIDITYFPFDDQSCTMKFGSWAYDGWQVNMSKRSFSGCCDEKFHYQQVLSLIFCPLIRSAVAPFRCLAAMPLEGSTSAELLPACPSLDRGIREAEVGFEPRTLRNTLICKSIRFCERLTWNPAESPVCDVLRQLNVLHQAASCSSCYDIRDITIHVYT